MMRRRLAAQVVLATLLATTLAGCSNASVETEHADGALKYGYVDADNKTHGSVKGIVLTKAGDPIPGALVTVLSVDGSATSNPMGRFNFTEVTKGEQTLRVAREGYKTLQRPFTVAAGKIVELEVVLARVDDLRGGAIEHFHDHWRGQELYTIYEGRLEFDRDATHAPTTPNPPPPIVPEKDRIVPPGTDRISIDISFEPEPMFNQESWRFYAYPPPGPSGSSYDTDWMIESKDEHLEYDLPSSELTDNGHATYTNWGFALERNNRVSVWAKEPFNLLFPISVDVTITAHKGDLAIDPPHPRYWADTDRIEMPPGPRMSAHCTVAGTTAWSCETRSPNPYVDFGGSDNQRRCFDRDGFSGACMVIDRGGLVPPGTTRISFDLEMWQAGTPWVGTEPPVLGETDWVLGFKTAAPPRGGATWDDYTWVEPVETYDPESQDGRYHQQGQRYMIEVPAGGQDPYYTVYSGWVFTMAVQGHETASDYSDMSCADYPCGRAYFEMKNLFVHNDSASDVEPA